MLNLGDWLADEGIVEGEHLDLTSEGAALLARAEAAERPTYARAKALLDALNKDGGGFVVNGMLHAAIIAEANAKDAPRVEAAPALDPTAAIVAFIATEEARYRRNSKDPAHDAAGRERCANKASVLATIGRYIERGDHLTPPIDAPPAKEPAR